MTNPPSDTERQAFEMDAEAAGYGTEFFATYNAPRGTEHGQYVYENTRMAFRLWQISRNYIAPAGSGVSEIVIAVREYMDVVIRIFALRKDGPPLAERSVMKDDDALTAFDDLNHVGKHLSNLLGVYSPEARKVLGPITDTVSAPIRHTLRMDGHPVQDDIDAFAKSPQQEATPAGDNIPKSSLWIEQESAGHRFTVDVDGYAICYLCKEPMTFPAKDCTKNTQNMEESLAGMATQSVQVGAERLVNGGDDFPHSSTQDTVSLNGGITQSNKALAFWAVDSTAREGLGNSLANGVAEDASIRKDEEHVGTTATGTANGFTTSLASIQTLNTSQEHVQKSDGIELVLNEEELARIILNEVCKADGVDSEHTTYDASMCAARALLPHLKSTQSEDVKRLVDVIKLQREALKTCHPSTLCEGQYYDEIKVALALSISATF